jgi:hypothetical protein
MRDIALASNDSQQYVLLLPMLWKRLCDVEHHLHVSKALSLTLFLLRHGSTRFQRDVKMRIANVVSLQTYKHYVEDHDVGQVVRHKADIVVKLMNDDKALAAERKKASETAARVSGVSSSGLSREEYEKAAVDDRKKQKEQNVQAVTAGASVARTKSKKAEVQEEEVTFTEDNDDPFADAPMPPPPKAASLPAASSRASTTTTPPPAPAVLPPVVRAPEIDLFAFDATSITTSAAPAQRPVATVASPPSNDPFAIFSQPSSQNNNHDPFASSSADPFAVIVPQNNPFAAPSQAQQNPFGNDPFGQPAPQRPVTNNAQATANVFDLFASGSTAAPVQPQALASNSAAISMCSPAQFSCASDAGLSICGF